MRYGIIDDDVQHPTFADEEAAYEYAATYCSTDAMVVAIVEVTEVQ
jgi:hypothetical protein